MVPVNVPLSSVLPMYSVGVVVAVCVIGRQPLRAPIMVVLLLRFSTAPGAIVRSELGEVA